MLPSCCDDQDSHLPVTLIGNEAQLFSKSPTAPSQYKVINGGTVEAIGAIHFASAGLRNGTAGVKPDQLYLELHAQ